MHLQFPPHRVHLQVAQWKHLDLTCHNPLHWGWTLQNNSVVPVKTDLPAALDWLLQVVRCKCKTTTKHPCSTLISSCCKNGLTCVAACGSCHGEDCENIAILLEEENTQENADRNIFDLFDTNITKFLCFVDFAWYIWQNFTGW